jgi:hypothetical protein
LIRSIVSSTAIEIGRIPAALLQSLKTAFSHRSVGFKER